HDAQPCLRSFEVTVLPGPVEAISRWQLDLVSDRLFRIAHVVVDRSRSVGEDVSGELAILVPQHRRPGAQPEVRDLTEGNLRSVHRRDTHAAESTQVRAEVPRISDGDRISLTAFDGGGDGQPAYRGLDHVFHIADIEPESRRSIAVDVEIEEVAAADPLGERAARPGH